VPSKIFEPKIEEVTWAGKKVLDDVKGGEMGVAYGTHGGEEKCMQGCG